MKPVFPHQPRGRGHREGLSPGRGPPLEQGSCSAANWAVGCRGKTSCGRDMSLLGFTSSNFPACELCDASSIVTNHGWGCERERFLILIPEPASSSGAVLTPQAFPDLYSWKHGTRELRCCGASDRVQRAGGRGRGAAPGGLGASCFRLRAGHSSFTLHVTLRKSPGLDFSDCIHATPKILRCF